MLRNFNHPNHQIHHFVVSDEQLKFPSKPCDFLPYVGERTQLPPHRDDKFLQANGYYPFSYYSARSYFPKGLSNYGIQTNWESSIDESERKKKGAMMSKIARNIRKQARQRARSSSSSTTSRVSSILEQASMGDNNVHKNEIIIPDTLHSLDGKRLKKLFTKKLKSSDVSFIGRIVIPKNEAEKKLPALSNKEGIEVVLKDVCTNQQWSMKYKYWCNNKSRMYVLENTGSFVRHYQLQIGDSIALFEDKELKNLYVLPKREQTPEVAHRQFLSYNYSNNINNFIDMPPYLPEKNYCGDETCFGKLIEELFNQKEQESSSYNKLSNVIVGGSSSNPEEPLYSSNNAEQAEVSVPNGTGEGKLLGGDSLDDFFEGLDMSQFGRNFISS